MIDVRKIERTQRTVAPRGAPLSTYRRGFECAKRRPEDLGRRAERDGERETRTWEADGSPRDRSESKTEDEGSGEAKPTR